VLNAVYGTEKASIVMPTLSNPYLGSLRQLGSGSSSTISAGLGDFSSSKVFVVENDYVVIRSYTQISSDGYCTDAVDNLGDG
jgi:hypothetical protein